MSRMSPTEPLYFVHISDTHFGPTVAYSRHGHVPYPCAKMLVSRINELPTKPDFVVHTGDVVTDPDDRAYALAASVFAELEMPIYYVNGNHDRAVDIQKYLPMGPRQSLSATPELLTYQFEVKGYQFLVVDGRGPDEIDPHGLVSDEQLAIVRQLAKPEGPPLTLFVHYPTHPLNSIWMDAYMLLINGQAFHEALLPARERLRGVFSGHVHQNMQTVRDGILYTAVASTFSQFTAWPNDVVTGLDPDHPPAFNFVHLLPDQTIIHQHLFPRPKGGMVDDNNQ